MVKDRRVQQMYVEGKCVKGVCMCVIESCVTMRAYVRACVYVCVVWPPASDTSVRNKQTCYPSMRNIFHACAHLFFSSLSIAVSKLSHLHRKPGNSDERFSNAFRPDLPAKLLSKMFHPRLSLKKASPTSIPQCCFDVWLPTPNALKVGTTNLLAARMRIAFPLVEAAACA